jgi:hypothetical protein
MAAFSGNIIYYAIFAGKKLTYRIEIRKASYAGAATQIQTLASDPLILRHVEVENSTIQGSEMIFSFLVQKSEFDTYDLLVSGAEFDYKFTLYNITDLTKPLWSGFIMPAQTSRSYFNKNAIFSLTATDYLSGLKNIKFLNNGYALAGRVEPEQILAQCFDKVPDFEYFSIACSLTEASMPAITRSPLNRCFINAKIFSSIKNGIRVQDNCYDVVNQILQIFSCRVSSPVYNLANYPANYMKFAISNSIDETSTNWYSRYTSGASAYVSNTANYSSGINIDAYKFALDSEFSREKPLTCLELIQHNFDGGLDNTSDNFMTVTNGVIWNWYNLTALTAETSTALKLVSTSTTVCSIDFHNWYTLQSDYGNSFIRLSFDLTNPYGSPNCNPVIRITPRILGVNQTQKVITLPTLLANSTYKYISPANSQFEILDGYDYKVSLEFQTTASNVKTVYISNFKFSNYFFENGTVVDNIAYDENYTAYTVVDNDPSITLNSKIGDSWKAGNDSAITYSTTETHLTSAWKRASVTESRYIQDLLFQNYFNKYGGDSRILKLKIYDPDDNISIRNKIILESKTYLILDIEKNFKSGWVDLRLLKVNSSNVSFTMVKTPLPSSSTGGGQTTSGGTVGVGTTIINNYYTSGGGGTSVHSSLSGLSANDHPQYRLVADGFDTTITAKNGNAPPSEYPKGLSTMSVGDSQTDWVTTYGTVHTLNIADASRLAQYFFQTSGNYAVYYRHRTNGADTWQPWFCLTTPVYTAGYSGRKIPRIQAITSSSSITPNIDSYDIVKISALATNTTFNNPSGTPSDEQTLVISIMSDATIRTLSFSGSAGGYISGGVAIPSATVASKVTSILFIYDSASNKWKCRSVAQE